MKLSNVISIRWYAWLAAILCSVAISHANAQTATSSAYLQDPNFAIDGDINTRWESVHDVDPAWITVDLQTTQLLEQISIHWEAANAADYDVRGSVDGSNWDVLASERGKLAGSRTDVVPLAGSYRYVQIYGIARSMGWGYSIWEIDISSSAQTPLPPTPLPPSPDPDPEDRVLSNGKPALSNSELQPAAFAFDDDAGSRWESFHGIDDVWISVDLEDIYELTQVDLQWETANAAAYQIQGSNDNITWTSLASRSGLATGERSESVSVSGAYRYVRMNGTARSTDWGYSLWGMQVIGHDSDGPNPTDPPTPTDPPDPNCDYPDTSNVPIGGVVFEENFDGSELDECIWNYETGTGINGDWGTGQFDYATDREENVRVGDGVLTITTRQESFTQDGETREYTSGRINTQNKVSWGPGHRIEARVWAKDVKSIGQGFAFWMMPDEIPVGYDYMMWPQGGEIDIMEYVGSVPNHNLGTVHYAWTFNANQWASWNHGHQGGYYEFATQQAYVYQPGEDDGPGYGNYPPAPNDPNTGSYDYHTYGIEWFNDRIEWYIDGNVYHIHYLNDGGAWGTCAKDGWGEKWVEQVNGRWVTKSEYSNLDKKWFPFEHDFYAIFSSGVGGEYTYGGAITDAAQFPVEVKVDYLRVTKIDANQGVNCLSGGDESDKHPLELLALSEIPAQSAQASSTRTEDFDNSPADVVDRNLGTRWESEWTDDQWITIDLGSVQHIDQVYLNWETAGAESYNLLGSTDNSNWTLLKTVTGKPAQPARIDLLGVDGNYRYLRMQGLNRVEIYDADGVLQKYGYSLFEFAAYREKTYADKQRRNVVAAYASSTKTDERANVPIDGADFDFDSRWESEWLDGQWYTIDLGSSQSINELILIWQYASASAYTIEGSNDNANWSTLASLSNLQLVDKRQDNANVNGSYRYLRVNVQQRATEWGVSLYEFLVFGPK